MIFPVIVFDIAKLLRCKKWIETATYTVDILFFGSIALNVMKQLLLLIPTEAIVAFVALGVAIGLVLVKVDKIDECIAPHKAFMKLFGL